MRWSAATRFFGALTFGFSLSVPAVSAATETVLYSFCNTNSCAGGSYPQTKLINVGGTLYGTTVANGLNGEGTIFSFNLTTGVESLVYSFCRLANCADGALPFGDLTYVNGRLYGTTNQGGNGYCDDNPGCGVVFVIDLKTGIETVLRSFSGDDRKRGFQPTSGLLSANGMLYGTTPGGGTYNHGVVFSLDKKTGFEKVLYSFSSKGRDGGEPNYAKLIDVEGTLYGTTEGGGDGHCAGTTSCGTVFSLDPSTGQETILHDFCYHRNCTDGFHPLGGLLSVEGVLYGTTKDGGSGLGTVYSIDTTTGSETVIHSFSGVEGAIPLAGLIDLNGQIYGTTYMGGSGSCDWGTVFSVDPNTGALTVLISFDRKNGGYPSAALTKVKAVLYGTTTQGGTHGGGTIFAINL